MKIAVVGGGPAGLYFAYLAKRAHPDWRVGVAEQNPADATFGFGVVFSGRALGFLAQDDPETHAALVPSMQAWDDFRIVHRDEIVTVDGNGFASIGRLALLRFLQERCRSVGVDLEFGRAVAVPATPGQADLAVGADGVNSVVRRRFAGADRLLDNRFVWYGTTKPFDCLTLTFRANADGAFVAHHYRYAPDMSTFIVECDARTFARAGFAAMDDKASRAYCEVLFAPDLGGRPLVSNRSIWRRFPLLESRQWQDGRTVLLGDALRTVHFSIGSGTRLALEDALALARALAEEPADLGAALARFEAERRPPAEALAGAGVDSALWYERLPGLMALSPYALAHSYMTRTGRMSDARLAELAPAFMARYHARRGASG
jgi:2-polyprenyl-6-methoxyphenol hydroxylase-like FAD-dependent oxidoreductase